MAISSYADSKMTNNNNNKKQAGTRDAAKKNAHEVLGMMMGFRFGGMSCEHVQVCVCFFMFLCVMSLPKKKTFIFLADMMFF